MYRAIYKCRLCGKQFDDGHYFSDDNIATVATIHLTLGQTSKFTDCPHAFRRHKEHFCEGGSIGFADFMGFEKVEEQENE